MMYGWGYGNMFGIGGIFMMLSMAIFWGLLIAGVMFLVRTLSGTRPVIGQATRPKALDILEERYAKGEIDTEEYQAKKRELTG